MTRAAVITVAVLGLACAGERAPEADTAQGEQTEVTVTSRYRLDPNNVPADLRHLVPLAERWGIGDDVERGDYGKAASPDDRKALRDAVVPLYPQITTWLDSFGDSPMPDEAAAFMYLQLAIEEMPD